MKAVLQRVTSSSVSIGGRVIAEIGQGLNILLGVGQDDDESVVSNILNSDEL